MFSKYDVLTYGSCRLNLCHIYCIGKCIRIGTRSKGDKIRKWISQAIRINVNIIITDMQISIYSNETHFSCEISHCFPFFVFLPISSHPVSTSTTLRLYSSPCFVSLSATPSLAFQHFFYIYPSASTNVYQSRCLFISSAPSHCAYLTALILFEKESIWNNMNAISIDCKNYKLGDSLCLSFFGDFDTISHIFFALFQIQK